VVASGALPALLVVALLVIAAGVIGLFNPPEILTHL